MEFKKLVILLLILQGQFLYSAELKEAEENIGTLDVTENVENRPEFLTLISSEGNEYTVPFEVVMQSKMAEVAWQGDQVESKIDTCIENKYLEPLIVALSQIRAYKDDLNSKELYEEIQNTLNLSKYNIKD